MIQQVMEINIDFKKLKKSELTQIALLKSKTDMHE